ncbi:MAG: nucleoside-diphosphate kinase [Candidatus Moranbacteria bacterium]|nr:nucleoside-diphosphate kinase [Candidatus Moranbacteria bacterium]
MERTLVIIKPDGLQRNLVGQIISRFERKGLKMVGMKMMKISDLKIEEHYGKYKDKPFFKGLKNFMQSAPVIAIVLEGLEAIEAARFITGSTKAREADAGTIRGDFAMGLQTNLVHVSDPKEDPEAEIKRFFGAEDLLDYDKIDFRYLYSSDELG